MAEETLSNEQQTELLFMQLVMMFQGMAMQQLGKVMNPMTQKVERDLGQAKNFIDLLSMLEAKTKGNLTDNEEKLLQQSLFDLRMNYVDEMKKADSPEESLILLLTDFNSANKSLKVASAITVTS